jgi:hypothetical protein
MRRLVAGVVVGAICLLPVSSAGAAAQDGTQTAGGQISNGSPEAVVVVGRSGDVASWSGSAGGGGGSRWRCGYYAFEVNPSDSDGVLAVVDYDAGPVDPEPEQHYVLACFDQDGRQVRSLLSTFDPGDPFGGIAATERALEEARRMLDLPVPSPGLNPPGAQLVGVPTWLWVDGPWQPASATASVGAVSATVTARPTGVEWDMGDGTTETCGPGTPYDTARAPSAQHSDCTHVFTHSSTARTGGTYAVTATVTYDVDWTASTGGGGPLGSLTRSATVPVTVQEAQALIR